MTPLPEDADPSFSSVETAREMLELDAAKESGHLAKQVKTESEGMYAAGTEDNTCDDCAFFDGDNNRCLVTGEERVFDQAACRKFLQVEAGLVTKDVKA